MSRNQTKIDRRQAYRVQPRDAVAQCFTKRTSDLYAVRDLSRGGIALEGRAPLTPGSKVGIHLMVPGHESMSLRGTVLRTTARPTRGSRVVVQFGRLDADAEDNISDMIVTELVMGPRCVVASSSERERKVLSKRLEAQGVHVLQAATPMEVIHRLETSPRPVDTIVIGNHVGDCDGVEFASFVASAYPRVRRVLSKRPSGRRAELADHVAHASLNGRWEPEDLRAAVLQQKRPGQ